MTTPVRLLIVEDHPVFRDGLAAAFDQEPDICVVGAVGTVEEAAVVLNAESVDVALVDLGLPDGSGLDVIRLLRSRPEASGLVLTMHDDRTTILHAVRAGARGYLLKGAGRNEIVDAVRRTASGGSVFGQGPADVLLAAATGADADPAGALGLTAREADVLRLVSSGLTNDAIARRLSLAPKTVRNQVSLILTKLGVETRAQAAARAHSVGLVDPTHDTTGPTVP